MKIAVAGDHRGIRIKGELLERLKSLGHEVEDLGPESDASVDYPDYAAEVAGRVSRGECDRGILACGTGVGMCIAANKFRGVRAVICSDEVTAEMSRRHNNANVMCLSADLLSDKLLGRIIEVWLRTDFEGGRHDRRLKKIEKIEREQMQQWCCEEE